MRRNLFVPSVVLSCLVLGGCPHTEALKSSAPSGAATSVPASSAPASAPAAATTPPSPPVPAPGTVPVPPDVAAAPADAQKMLSGLVSKVLQPGTGKEHPGIQDTVTVHYSGWMTNGDMFDSSVMRGEPPTFPLNSVIKGWTEGVQLMVEGEKRRFWIPANLAYGERPSRPGMPFGTLVFDIELLKIQK